MIGKPFMWARLAWTTRQLGELSGWLYAVILVLVVGEVVMRAIFGSPTSWTLEVSVMLAGVAYVLNGAALPQLDHIRIDLVVQRLPHTPRRVATIIAALVSGTYLLVLVFWGADQAATSIEFGERSGSVLNSPLPMVHKIAIPVAAAIMALGLVGGLLAGERGKDDPKS